MSDFPTSLREGRYAVVGVLGEGAQGQTLRAVDKREGRPVAIKRFVVRGARSWKDVELAEREARVLSELRHPRLPRYVEHFEENGELYLVLELLEGESLQALRRRGGRLGRAEVLRLLRELGEVLEYLHTRAPPIIHRDIKPGNVIRRPDGSFTLVDFGSVRDRLRLEGGSTIVGTFGYMAPEQFQGRALPQTDVYAVGVTALALLTGEEPENLPHQGLKLDVARILPNDPELSELLGRLVEPDPDRRPPGIVPLLQTRRTHGAGSPPSPGEAESPRSGEAWPRAPVDEPTEPRADPLPPLVLALFVVGLSIARVAVHAAVGLFVPTLLFVLSLLFGRGLRVAAHNVRRASARADQALAHALAVVRRLEIARAPAYPRPDTRGRRRVRVEADQRRGRPRVVLDTTAEEADEHESSDEPWRERASTSERQKR